MRRAIPSLAVLLLLAVPVTGLAASLTIVNGDFEAGVDPGSTFTRLPAGAGDISGWTILPTSVDYVGGFWDAASGVRFVDLDGNFGEAGGIAQTIATTPGQPYVIHFEFAGLPIPGGPDIKRLRVRAGSNVTDYEFSVIGKSAQNMGWVHETFTFTAGAAATLLEFISTTDPPGNGPAIDNVWCELSVSTEASTWGRIKAMFSTTAD